MTGLLPSIQIIHKPAAQLQTSAWRCLTYFCTANKIQPYLLKGTEDCKILHKPKVSPLYHALTHKYSLLYTAKTRLLYSSLYINTGLCINTEAAPLYSAAPTDYLLKSSPAFSIHCMCEHYKVTTMYM